jgi:tetratricopeptide (TPR) repeat protein
LDSWGREEYVFLSRLDEATALFGHARTIDETRDEASVRGAFLLFHRGRLVESLAWLSEVRNPRSDPELLYWANLFRGRVLQALGRHSDAEQAYRAALLASPDAQSAGVGLAATLLRLGRRDEAAEAAASVRRAPQDAVDPWWDYDRADARFVRQWRDWLRAESR